MCSGASYSNRSVLSQVVSSFAASDPLLPMWIYLSHYVLFVLGFLWCHRQMRPRSFSRVFFFLAGCGRSFPGSVGTSPAPRSTRALFLSLTRSVSAILSLYACIRPCLSRQSSLNDRSDSLSAFVVMWFDRSSMRCKRSTTRTTSSVSVILNVC